MTLLNISFDIWVVPLDCHGASIMYLYEGKGDEYECNNSRGISLFSAVGKLFGRVLLKLGLKLNVQHGRCSVGLYR